ncbi:MAG: phosphate ABC transporter substrate-binding protein [Gammaproteobacteria bacterium]|nr:phosphate ABC transporter substrate-binding protein [Gammaproteobacteria bacterium]
MHGLTTKSCMVAAFLLLINSGASAVANDDNTIRWAGCGITKKAFMAELAKGYEKKTGIKVKLEGGGATRGIRDTSSLKIDIGGSCRMSLPETDRTELYASLHPVAWDALAIIVHKSNPVKNLSTAQIKDIYAGKVTNWKQLGGNDAPIKLYARQGNISGVGYAIRQYIFKDGGMEFRTKYKVRSSGPLEKAVEKDPNAMGITGISSARKRDVKVIEFDGKQPSMDNLMKGKYQLYRPLYLVTSPKPSKKVKEFISFAMSPDGRKIIRNNQTVPYKDAPNLMSKMLVYGFDVR